MNILVTGATGFIGSNLTERLISGGHVVHVLSRDEKKAKYFKNKNITFFTGDITDLKTVVRASDGCDWVFHLAAYAKVWSKDKCIYNVQNVEGTENVLKAALQNGIRRVLVVSTAGVLGPSNGKPVNESTVRTKPFFTEYERSKSMADQVGRVYLEKGLDIVTVYPTRVFGPGPLNESNSATKLIQQYARGRWRIIPGSGRKTGNYVYIENLVMGMIKAMEKGLRGECYLLGGSNISFLEYFSTISSITGKKHFMVRIPLFLALFVSSGMLLFARITGIPPLITPGWIRKYLHNWSVSSEKSIQVLEYDPGTFSEGIRRTMDWLDTINKGKP